MAEILHKDGGEGDVEKDSGQCVRYGEFHHEGDIGM